MKDTAHILQLIKRSVESTAPGATLILYGSYARGDYNEESDIDLLVLVDKDKICRDDEIKITYPLYDIQFQTGVLISPIVYTRKYWQTGHMVTPFYENVNREGVRL
ncbi:MAG: nucleotidyltransferase domain-containing protein [Bacteroidota bacterium]